DAYAPVDKIFTIIAVVVLGLTDGGRQAEAGAQLEIVASEVVHLLDSFAAVFHTDGGTVRAQAADVLDVILGFFTTPDGARIHVGGCGNVERNVFGNLSGVTDVDVDFGAAVFLAAGLAAAPDARVDAALMGDIEAGLNSGVATVVGRATGYVI